VADLYWTIFLWYLQAHVLDSLRLQCWKCAQHDVLARVSCTLWPGDITSTCKCVDHGLHCGSQYICPLIAAFCRYICRSVHCPLLLLLLLFLVAVCMYLNRICFQCTSPPGALVGRFSKLE
jgi:hypothetical protein